MSRHLILSTEHMEVVVGWDRPLQSFFLEVVDPNFIDEEGNKCFLVIKEAGLVEQPYRIEDIHDLEELAAEYAPLSDDIKIVLMSEQIGFVDANTYTDWTKE
jgi:hypothetical protein